MQVDYQMWYNKTTLQSRTPAGHMITVELLPRAPLTGAFFIFSIIYHFFMLVSLF